MTLTQLHHFYYFIKHGSFASAARELGIEKAALHQQLRRLQASVGKAQPLWQPSEGGGFAPTARGRELFAFVEPFFRGLPQVVEQVSNPERGTLAVAHQQGVGEELLAPAAADFAQDLGDVRLRVSAFPDARAAAEAVAAWQADLAVVAASADATLQTLEAEPLVEIPFVVATGRGTALAQRKRAAWSDLAGVRLAQWLSPRGNATAVDAALTDRGLLAQAALQTESPAVLRRYVIQTPAAAITDAALWLDAGEAVRLWDASSALPPLRLLLLSRRKQTMPAPAAALREILLSQAEELRKRLRRLPMARLNDAT